MLDLDAILSANRAAVDDLLAAAERIPPDSWTTPWAPRKWSPSQIVEHVAMTLEEGGNVVAERPSKLPSFPSFLRPLGGLLFRRVLKKGGFPKLKTVRAMDPSSGPTHEGARARLEAAIAAFEKDCRDRASAGGTFTSGAFGRVSVEEYARFQELHTRHHAKQMPVVL
jgi:hypothetical protein